MTKNNTLFVVFILGALVAFVYFTFIQQSDRRVVVHAQLDEVEQQLSDVEILSTSCQTFVASRENTPGSVRQQCVESRGFVLWARRFPSDPTLGEVRAKLITLADTVEEMTGLLSQHPNSTYGEQLLDQIPTMVREVRDEVSQVRKKFVL